MKFKSIFLLSFLTLALFSCKKDDSTPIINDTSTFTFVGTWKIKQQFIDDIEQTIPECEQQTNYVFDTDGNANENIYEGLTSDDCFNFRDYGTWKTKTDNILLFNTLGGELEDEIEFVLDNNELTTILLEAGKTYRDVYKK